MTASSTNNIHGGDGQAPTPTLRVLDIVDGTIVDGPGLRTSVYLAGCTHHCPGCHNPQSWEPTGGEPMGIDEIVRHVEENGFNVTLTGGDPLYQIGNVIELCKELRQRNVNIWLYTGYTYEQVCASSTLSPILDIIDVMVDGPFIESQRDISLRFRGSANQRIIDVNLSTPKHPVIWTD